MDSTTILKLKIGKTIDELLKIIDDKIKNKDEEYVVEFKKKLMGMQDSLEDK